MNSYYRKIQPVRDVNRWSWPGFPALMILLILQWPSTARAQGVYQIGYYNFNGVFSVAAAPGLMVPGNGHIVDITNPTAPVSIGNISLPALGSSVLTDGSLVYYGTGMSVKLIIVDITSPSNPTQTGILSFPQTNNGIFGMAKQNQTLYLAVGAAGFYSVDVSNPSSPSVLDSLPIANGQTRDVALSGSYAFLAHYGGMKVVDVSNPASMNLLNSIGTGYNSAAINGALAFMGKNSGGVDVYDISTPIVPQLLYSIPNAGGTAWDMQCKNDHLYLSTDVGGLYIYQYNSSSAQFKAQFANIGNGQSFGVALHDSLILLSGLINGVAVLVYDSLGNVGIQSMSGDQELLIYPNPASDQLNLSFSQTGKVEIQMINIYGEMILEESLDAKMPLDISTLPSGIYLLKIQQKDRRWIRRFVVDR